MRAVSIGGGTGQPNTARALMSIGYDVSAVVGMVDDGGSTGLLRRDMGVVPPGDVRKCLVAMAEEPDGPLARAFQRRFAFADDHAMGNLFLAALAQETGSFAEAVQICARILKCRGEVLPSTLEDVVLCGRTLDGHELRGQAALCAGPCALSRVWLSPAAPAAYPPAVEAILNADAVVLGPGSLFTSIIPNLLVPGILQALHETRATRVYVCSMADVQGETRGFGVAEYFDALFGHGMEGAVDVALVHRPAPGGRDVAARRSQALAQGQVRAVEADDAALRDIGRLVPSVIVRDFSDGVNQAQHDAEKLASTLQGVLGSCRTPRS